MSVSVAVAGASGYAGGELLRVLSAHPEFDVRTVTAFSNAGQPLIATQPHLRSLSHLTLEKTTAETLRGHDVVFLALPHGQSGAITEELGDDALVVDCGADHRLTDPAAWEQFYGGDYHGAWTYGLPELLLAAPTPGSADEWREVEDIASQGKQRSALVGTKRIAVPGCNVTAVTLGIQPGIQAGLVESDDIVAVLSVGPSGAGKKLANTYLASEIMGSASAYAVGGTHRHVPEIQQNLVVAGAADVTISFTPVLVPMSRGILATTTAKLTPGVSARDVRLAWEQAYADEPFVHLLPEGEFPRVADTIGANTALVGIAVDEAAGRVVAVTALDNLAKGTAGAAVQSTNIALGLPETLGLSVDGVAP
ncbi:MULTISPECIES: NAGSA dehydrogenase family protein [Curtobacterium]|uniref:N-acetyl-gamma-glutamyl-phosphate reductase n=1 Tax=Bacteria TaxID=2 RepID=UPI000F491CFE|nr:MULTISPECIES: NAGSA dehydrogenase family protein [Curtobacterium]MBF4588180.1 N-acetyl-gamma-glutamyl-phosphate reductase [Curtobacterium sp. VKM Ac-2887]MBT1622809.1 N-acetyl-gamma-glutamyl-phosphate reductase [Curtobacterium flaccumfaciens pv. oortii]ROQ04864.1 N-acetyl-gamma-glutamyl-phosphate reductase [Curtobacterium sp. PhB171]ROQ22064.1 N-acetyl-gamma-glutamyl-phosphate reductase [Curtobacterium sp. PhB170]ROS33424.1 N-acetyl-gamma-glutamyl-phosphate reductase [Curtobacterium sp. PhB